MCIAHCGVPSLRLPSVYETPAQPPLPPLPLPADSPPAPVLDPPVSPIVDRKTRVSSQGTHRPRLPHERDESADSQTGVDNDVEQVVRQAHDDLQRGLVDTGTGPVIGSTYDRLKGRSP